ncbi:MAG TPA: hypothetical protein VHQ03_13385 [Candidatus Dormibacteraeota bacterium]|nr:hypothetical protein [Candidatus Dormibacteraeota bacterium]
MAAHELPDDFADTLARVLEPHETAAVAEIIEAATRLDDEALGSFLRMFASRVRASSAPVRAGELRKLLEQASRSAAP